MRKYLETKIEPLVCPICGGTTCTVIGFTCPVECIHVCRLSEPCLQSLYPACHCDPVNIEKFIIKKYFDNSFNFYKIIGKLTPHNLMSTLYNSEVQRVRLIMEYIYNHRFLPDELFEI